MQIQRLAIARAILSGPPILLLDEATSALDEATEKRLITNLRSLTDITCVLISHRKTALELCDKEIRIENGHLTTIERGRQCEMVLRGIRCIVFKRRHTLQMINNVHSVSEQDMRRIGRLHEEAGL